MAEDKALAYNVTGNTIEEDDNEGEYWPELSQPSIGDTITDTITCESTDLSTIKFSDTSLLVTDINLLSPTMTDTVVQEEIDLLAPLPPPPLLSVDIPLTINAPTNSIIGDTSGDTVLLSQDVPMYSQDVPMYSQDIPTYSQDVVFSQDIPTYSQDNISQDTPVYQSSGTQDSPVYQSSSVQDTLVYQSSGTQDTPVYQSSSIHQDTPVYQSSGAQDTPVYQQDIPIGASIIITNIHPDVTSEELTQMIQFTGSNIISLSRISSTSYIVHFSTILEAFNCITLNGTELGGQPIQINLSDHTHGNDDQSSSSLYHEIQPQKITMSYHLYKCFLEFASQEIHLFEQKDKGVLTHSDDILYIEAPTSHQIDAFMTQTVAKYTQKSIPLTQDQWKDLTSNNASKYNSLVLPFRTHTQVKILPIALVCDELPQLLLVGVKKAVESAHEYLWNILAKDIKIDKIKLQAFKQLFPELPNALLERYQVNLTYETESINIDSQISQNITQARRELEGKLSQLSIEKLPRCKPILLLSFKRCLASNDDNPQKAIVVSDGRQNINYLCCVTGEALGETLKVFKRPLHKEVHGRGNDIECLRSGAKCSRELCEIEQDHLVDVSVKENKVVIRCYDESSLKCAKDKIVSLIKSSSVVHRVIDCPLHFKEYIHHVLFTQPNEETKKFISNLRIKISTKEGGVYLEGPTQDVEKDEKNILKFFLPSDLKHREFVFDKTDCRFISHIESECLRSLHQKTCYTHVIRRHDNQEGSTQRHSGRNSQQQRRRPSETKPSVGFTISVFSANKEDFLKVCTEIEKLNPCTESVSVSLKSMDDIAERKNLLEKTHLVRIFLVKSGPTPKVLIHGIRTDDVTSCRIAMEGSLVVTKKIDVNGFQVVYLKTKCSTKLNEWRKEKCTSLSLPPMKIHTQDLSKKYFIELTGKTSLVDAIIQELRDYFQGLYDKQLSVSCSYAMLPSWKKRWNDIKKDLETKHEVIIEYYESEAKGERGGKGGQRRGSAPPRPLSTRLQETKAVVNFVIFGLNKDSVESVCQIIETTENGQSVTREIQIKSDYPSIVTHPGELVKVLGLVGSVWLYLRDDKIIVTIPSSSALNIDNIVEKITTHLESESKKSLSLEYSDEFLWLNMKTKGKAILDKASKVAVREEVLMKLKLSKCPLIVLTLTGTNEALEIVKSLVEEAVEKVNESKCTQVLQIDYLKAPFLKTDEFKSLSESIKKDHCVIITGGTVTSSDGNNKVIKSKEIKLLSGRTIKISLMSGNILKESVDCIVNAANVRLDHIGGLAAAVLSAGGTSIQTESNRYVETHGPLKHGNAVCLGAGTLPYKCIIHAVAPIWTNNPDPLILQRAVLNACKEARAHSMTSIAIPALGTGIYRVPNDVCAKASLQAIHEFYNSYPTTTLCDVRFVLQPQSVVTAFEKAFNQSEFLNDTRPKLSLTTRLHSQTSHISSLPLGTTHPQLYYPPTSATPFHGVTSLNPRKQSQLLKWYWKDDEPRGFTPYDSQTNDVLTEAYSSDPSLPCNVTIRGTVYSIDFQLMTQTNTTTKFSRKIKLTKGEEEEEIQWYYKDDKQQWTCYDSHCSSQLERWYSDGTPTGQLVIGKHTYSFDFATMTQINVVTQNQRDIKRSTAREEDEEEETEEENIKWCFQNDKQQYQQYTQEQSEQLEEWYQNKDTLTTGECQMIIGKFTYRFDMENMTQCNVSSNTTRSMKREGQTQQVTTTLHEKMVTITLCGTRTGINNATILLQGKLDSCLSFEKINISSSSKKLEASLQKIASQKCIRIDLVPLRGENAGKEARLTGLSNLVKEGLTDMQKCIISHMESVAAASTGATNVIKPPKEWQSQHKTVELFTVREGTPEYRGVERKFKATMNQVSILSIERIQNKYLWDKYANHKSALHQKNGGQVNEMELFHGTRGNDPKKIYDSEEGFDMRFSAEGMWGQANYFAVNASYSNSYAHTTSTTLAVSSMILGRQGQVKQMFLAKVLTGVTYQCSQNRNLRMPPEKPSYESPNAVQLSQVRYDTVKGNTGGSDVYMTYDNMKAYPAYLISYN